eukprot:jgi/Bigna1/81480/fgenesh1_pg.81_\
MRLRSPLFRARSAVGPSKRGPTRARLLHSTRLFSSLRTATNGGVYRAPGGFEVRFPEASTLGAGTLPVVDPASLAQVAEVADMDATHAEEAVSICSEVQDAWAAKTPHMMAWQIVERARLFILYALCPERAAVLENMFTLMTDDYKEDLAHIITVECGKPLAESRGEVAYAAAFFKWFAEEGKRAYGRVIPSNVSSKRLMTIKQPVGVCAAVTPWNFPSAMITRKLAPALAAGCTMVVKPAEDTPLSAIAIANVAEEAGLMPGVLQVVTSSRANTPGVGKGHYGGESFSRSRAYMVDVALIHWHFLKKRAG